MSPRVALAFATAFHLAASLPADDEAPMNLVPQERLAEPDILPASDEAAIAMTRFRLPPGFRASLWAAEPMLANPVAIDFDVRGRLFVAETYRYGSSVLDIRRYMGMLEDDLASRTIEDRLEVVRRNLGEAGLREISIEGEVLRLLQDRDGDGVADHSSIYADGFRGPLDGIASGVLTRGDEVWFTNIPSLWHFKGVERAESRRELSRGYGVHFGYTGHDLHGLAWGPDGRLYFSIGDRGAHAVSTIDGSRVSNPDTGAVYRCNPDGSALELIHDGLRNPQELIFTENGDLFTGDNDSDQGDQERLVHVLEGAESGWRIGYQFAPLGDAGPWNRERLWWPRHPGQPAYLVPPVSNIEDGPSGIAYHPGTGLVPGFEGAIFVTHFKGAISRSGIDVYKLRPDGAGHAVESTSTFLGNALPTDVTFGPDGRLYYSDWVEAWPKSKRGRIYAIEHPAHADDPLVAEVRHVLSGGLEKLDGPALARLLGHADQRVRREAQYLLAERGATGRELFASTAAAAGAAPLARLHAVWGLGQLASSGTPRALVALPPLLADADPEVRAQAARVLGDLRIANAAPTLIDLLRDGSPRVRYFAAQGLGKLAHAPAAPALLEALRANDDRDATLRHGLVMGLVGTNDPATLTAGARDASSAVRLGVLLAWRKLGAADLAVFLDDADPFLVGEAARAINDHPIPAALPALAARLADPRDDEMLLLRAINAAFRLGGGGHARALAVLAARGDVAAPLRTEALTRLAEWPAPPARDRIVGIFRPVDPGLHVASDAAAALSGELAALLADTTPEPVQAALFRALRALDLRSASDSLLAVLRDDSRGAAVRVAALEALDQFGDARLAEAVALAGASAQPALRLAALPIAARLSPESLLPVLENLAGRGNIREQRAAFGALGDLARPEAARLLLERLAALERGEVDAATQVDLLEAAARRTEAAVVDALAAREAVLAASPDPLAPFLVSLEGGDPRKGRDLFNAHPVLACQRCHVVDGQGGLAGPELSDIGARMTRPQLLEAVIKPNAAIAEGFDTVVLTTTSGAVHAGTLAAETPEAVELRLGDNSLVRVPRAEIARRDTAPSSMPEIYGAVMTRAEIRDLIEFLAGLRAAAVVEAGAPPKPRALRTTPVAPVDGGHGE